MSTLLGPVGEVRHVAEFLRRNHYLGPAARGIAWSDDWGVMVLANPTSRYLPHDRWLEITRWCLVGAKNGGSRQWKAVRQWLQTEMSHITTVVSYSDPSQGHTGALYKACSFRWAPTWHRLRPPPTGNGSWTEGQQQSVKDRWVYPLARDDERESVLAVNDESLLRRDPSIGYRDAA